MRVAVIIVNFRTPHLVIDALESLRGQVDPQLDHVVVVDNDSGDGSAELIEEAIARRGMRAWVSCIRSSHNGGFSAGNNTGIRAVHADYYVLLNSDTVVRPHAVPTLLADMRARPNVGIGGPRLESSDSSPQISCFRDHGVWSELIYAARTRHVTRLLRRFEVPLPVSDAPRHADWLSFACVMIRREVFEKVGLLDEGFFMYFEDADFCRMARAAGFEVSCFPGARVVHLCGGSSDVQSSLASGQRPPRYFFASRARYFHKGYGRVGLALANLGWYAGRTLSLARETFGKKAPHTCERAWLDNWTHAFRGASS